MVCDEPSLGNLLPTLQVTYCLQLYIGLGFRKEFQICPFTGPVWHSSQTYRTLKMPAVYPTKHRKLMTQCQKNGNLISNYVWRHGLTRLWHSNWIELNGIWVRALLGPMHLGLRTGPLCPIFCTKLEEPVPLPELQVAPILSFLIYSGSQKKEPRCACLSEAKASHSQNVDWGFLLSNTFPTSGVITQPHYT